MPRERTTSIRAIVTGHSRGLGAAIAEELLARGVEVIGVSRRPAPSEPSGVRGVRLDLSDTEAVVRWLEGPFQELDWDGVTHALLVNNAGVIEPVGPVGGLGGAEVARAVAVNVTAPLLLTNAFVAATAGVPERTVVQVSSGAATRPIAGWAVYCASKAALDHFTRTAAADRTPGVRYLAVSPGIIDTDMQAEIRAVGVERFPEHAKFVEYHRTGALADPSEAARSLLHRVLDDPPSSGSVVDTRPR